MAHVYTEESNFENIANAIRKKNGTDNTYAPNEMASAIEELKVGELDFSSIYDQEQADEINQYYKDGIEYAKYIDVIVDDVIKNGRDYFKLNNKVLYFPIYDKTFDTPTFMFYMSTIQYVPYIRVRGTINMMFQYAGALREVVLDVIQDGLNFNQIFSECSSLKDCEITNVKGAYAFNATFNHCYNLINLKIRNWNQKDINLALSYNLSTESIKYIIYHSIGGDEASERNLQLPATPFANWETFKTTTPTEEDRIMLGVDSLGEYANMTWDEIRIEKKINIIK